MACVGYSYSAYHVFYHAHKYSSQPEFHATVWTIWLHALMRDLLHNQWAIILSSITVELPLGMLGMQPPKFDVRVQRNFVVFQRLNL